LNSQLRWHALWAVQKLFFSNFITTYFHTFFSYFNWNGKSHWFSDNNSLSEILLNKTSLHQLMGNCLFLAVPYTLVDEEGCERKQPLNVFNDWKALIVGHTSTYSQNQSDSQVG